MITVHHLNRSRSHRILLLLEELGQPYTVKHYTRDTVTNLAPPELTAVHPLGKSPMVELDGRLIVESAAITEILCQRFAPQMIPTTDTDAYITHQELMHFAEGSMMTPILLRLYTDRLGDAAAPLHTRIKHQIDSHFSHMEAALRPSGHYVFDDISAADIMLSFPAEVAMRQNRATDFPRLAAFVAANQERPAYLRAVAAGTPPQS